MSNVNTRWNLREMFATDDEWREGLSKTMTMVDALAEGDMGIAVSANENKLVYTFTFAEFEEGTDTDAVAESLEKNMADQASVFENIANSIKEVVNVEDPKVVVAYNAADGTEIYSQEFSAQ